MSDAITRIDLERFALQDLDPERHAEIAAAADADPDLAAQLARITEAIDAAKVGLPPLVLPADPAPSPVAQPANNTRFFGLAALAAVAAMLLMAVIALNAGPTDPSPVTYRGDFDLQVEQIRGDNAHDVGALITGEPGDRLQFAITPQDTSWVMIYDVEDGGSVTRFLAPMEVDGGRTHVAAVELDDYQGGERIYVLVADEPVEIEAVREAVHRAHRTPIVDLDELPGIDADQRSVWVTKP